MSRYTTEELIARWRAETLTTEQMIGQILLALQDLEQRQRASERRAATPAPPTPAPAAPTAPLCKTRSKPS